ncbi:MAG: methyltransferase domain-containing protein [Actinomycetes bacterium]
MDEVRRLLAGDRTVVHDLGSGTGSMGRWLAPLLPGPQHWVLYDRDPELLAQAAAHPPWEGSDRAPVTVETRERDLTHLDPAELDGATLITASALLDVLSDDELGQLVAACTTAGVPTLITLTVTGRVDLTPSHPLDARLSEAFNAHQRRPTERGRLLGPMAASATAEAVRSRGLRLLARTSPWMLDADDQPLITAWLHGWRAAATEQRPGLARRAATYVDDRLAQAAVGDLRVRVEHQDLLVLSA